MKARMTAISIVSVMTLATVNASGAILTFNSLSPANNNATRLNWLNAAGIVAPQHLVDFEIGFVNNQNISGVGGLFPANLVISDTSNAGAAIIRSGAGVINGSNPVGTYSVTQNEVAFLELDFSVNPVDYIAFQDIDHTGTNGIVTFVGGGTANISFETTGAGGNSAEFFGIYRNNMPRITLVQLDSSGDGRWGVDTIEYGLIPEPASLGLLVISGIATIRRRRIG